MTQEFWVEIGWEQDSGTGLVHLGAWQGQIPLAVWPGYCGQGAKYQGVLRDGALDLGSTHCHDLCRW